MRRDRWILAGLLLWSGSGCVSVENWLVFRPTSCCEGARVSLPTPLEDVDLMTASDVKIHARWYPHPRGQSVILYCHGNGGNLESWGQATKEVYDNLGQSVLIFDYPGFGRSEGSPSETGCYEAAEAAYLWLTKSKNIHPDRIILMGESLGGGVAIDLASKHPHHALVLVRTFTSIPDVADYQVPILVSSVFMHNRFDSLAKLEKCRQPMFIAQADADRLIPFKQGLTLYQNYPVAEKELCILRGRTHQDPLPPEFYLALQRFLQRYPTSAFQASSQ